MDGLHVAVVGGGAAGFFGAITCAEQLGSRGAVTLYEATAHPLAKVRISGGGRCNLTHACFEPAALVRFYPRGGRELLGPFHRWQPRDTLAWFAARGVATKTESDGRIFPVSDDSASVVHALQQAAAQAGVRCLTRTGVRAVAAREGGFDLELVGGASAACDRLLLATGGGRAGSGWDLARSLGHTLAPPVPSLFTFHLDDARLQGLAGVSVPSAGLHVPGTALRERGPVLVTHAGLSGPVVLKLSAWGARELAAVDYTFPLEVNWLGDRSPESAYAALREARALHPKRQVSTWNPFQLPQRLWERLVAAAGLAPPAVWTTCANAALQALARQLTAGAWTVRGKSLNKEEFVTCGGVRLSEVDFRTMESKRCPGLFLAGEVLDIDGLTGGFNFQAAWTTGWIAGRALATARP